MAPLYASALQRVRGRRSEFQDFYAVFVQIAARLNCPVAVGFLPIVLAADARPLVMPTPSRDASCDPRKP